MLYNDEYLDFQKIAAVLHTFIDKLNENVECAELRDGLNLALLQLQRYYRSLRSRSLNLDQSGNGGTGSNILTRSLRGLSPMTPFRDAPDRFLWKWIDLDSPKAGSTLPARLDNKEASSIARVLWAAKQGDNRLLTELIERGRAMFILANSHYNNCLYYYHFS